MLNKILNLSFIEKLASSKTIKYLFIKIEKSMSYPFLKYSFKKRTGYKLNLNDPRSFNEKICWKKVYDRNPLLPIIADKYKVRDYLTSVLGTEKAKEILIPLIHVTKDPNTIPFESIPDEYIIKTTKRMNCYVLKDKMLIHSC